MRRISLAGFHTQYKATSLLIMIALLFINCPFNVSPHSKAILISFIILQILYKRWEVGID
jgi:hypothetical protein